MNNFFCVWNPDRGLPRYQHRSLNEATAEAERLARANPGQNFYVLGTMAVAQQPAAPSITTMSKLNTCLDADIPF